MYSYSVPHFGHFQEFTHGMSRCSFTGLGNSIASHVDEELDNANNDGDSNRSKDNDKSLVEGKPIHF